MEKQGKCEAFNSEEWYIYSTVLPEDSLNHVTRNADLYPLYYLIFSYPYEDYILIWFTHLDIWGWYDFYAHQGYLIKNAVKTVYRVL